MNQTHASTTDPEAGLFRQGKGKESKLCFMGQVLMGNRHALVITPRLTAATGTAARDAAERLVGDFPGRQRLTVGGDKFYDTREFVQSLRVLNCVPHVAQNCKGKNSAIDGRTTRYPGYVISHRVEERVGWMFTFMAAAFNLVRIRNRTAAVSP